jgi:hypothetical protein
MTHLAEVVDALIRREPEGRRTMPAPIDPSISPEIQIPDVVSGYRQTPAVTRGGLIYLAAGPKIAVFGPDGAARPFIDAAEDIGLHGCAYTAACDPFSRTVFVSESRDTGEETTLVALRRDTHSLRWRSNLVNNCTGLAVLPQQDILVASSYYGNMVHALQISDGTPASSAEVFQPTYLAAEPRNALVFVSTFERGAGTVVALQWKGSTGLGLVRLHTVEAAGTTGARRPVAVLPPLHGYSKSHLVVATQKTGALLVLSLPDYRLVHTHALPGVEVSGLGADSSTLVEGGPGPALVVLDGASKDALVFSWPLPGMPKLE